MQLRASPDLSANLDQHSTWCEKVLGRIFSHQKNSLMNSSCCNKSKENLNVLCFYVWYYYCSDSSPLCLLQVKYDFLYEKVHICCLEEWASPTYQKIYTTFILVILFLFPLILMLFLYTKIGYELWIKKRVGDASVLQTIHGSEMSKISRFVKWNVLAIFFVVFQCKEIFLIHGKVYRHSLDF